MCKHTPYQSNSAKPEIIHNRGRCKLCGDIIESTDRHGFVTCQCGACSVDGGHDYLRRCLTSPDCFEELSVIKPCGDSCENNWIPNPFSLSTASQKLILWAMDLTTVCVTDRFETGWRHIQWRAVDHRADHLQIFECGRKNSILFSTDKARPESAPKAVWPQFLPQTNTEHAETVDKKCPKSKCPVAETVWKHAKRTRGQTHVSWGGRGRWFKSSHSDQSFVWNIQKTSQIVRFRLVFLYQWIVKRSATNYLILGSTNPERNESLRLCGIWR